MSMPQAAAVFSVYKVRAKYSAFERKSCKEKFTDLDLSIVCVRSPEVGG
jgi:hypothetical protein